MYDQMQSITIDGMIYASMNMRHCHRILNSSNIKINLHFIRRFDNGRASAECQSIDRLLGVCVCVPVCDCLFGALFSIY